MSQEHAQWAEQQEKAAVTTTTTNGRANAETKLGNRAGCVGHHGYFGHIAAVTAPRPVPVVPAPMATRLLGQDDTIDIAKRMTETNQGAGGDMTATLPGSCRRTSC